MPKKLEPLLAALGNADPDKLNYPVMVSLKLDGIRCLIKDGIAVSRSFKPLPNKHLQTMMKGLPDGLDGEIIVGEPNEPGVFNRTQSAVMSREGQFKFRYYVFDWWNLPEMPFSLRTSELWHWIADSGEAPKFIADVDQHTIVDKDRLLLFEDHAVRHGFEGVIIRSPDGLYKWGRSTHKQGTLLRMKRWEDSEAEVTGFVELEHNHNEAQPDNFGRAKRSSHKAGKVAGGTLGTLLGRDLKTGQTIEVGTGFTADQRRAVWLTQPMLVGKIFTYKFIPYGVKDKPRHLVFKGFRAPIDL